MSAYSKNYADIDWSKDLGPIKKRRHDLKPNMRVISDDLGSQLEHHGYDDGRRTDSKSVFRRWTKDAGLVEKGNDRSKTERRLGSDPREYARDVAIATNMVKQGYKPRLTQYEE